MVAGSKLDQKRWLPGPCALLDPKDWTTWVNPGSRATCSKNIVAAGLFPLFHSNNGIRVSRLLPFAGLVSVGGMEQGGGLSDQGQVEVDRGSRGFHLHSCAPGWQGWPKD